jgi:hypothetical protein
MHCVPTVGVRKVIKSSSQRMYLQCGVVKVSTDTTTHSKGWEIGRRRVETGLTLWGLRPSSPRCSCHVSSFTPCRIQPTTPTTNIAKKRQEICHAIRKSCFATYFLRMGPTKWLSRRTQATHPILKGLSRTPTALSCTPSSSSIM